eukprot:TRINITY_DN7420_c0_g1_i1.p1 TRINITY_DN7420_c0_g1~~TRINITY_DN7420_c0_g1_i1.p1  ORF type:complete len:792 (+),score=301.44 TRINITY_DN7420_c0_g1_i1:45-2378(+)
MSLGSPRDKVKGLFNLYQEEKKAEAKTKAILRQLQDNSDEVLKAKLRVIEKLLDIKVKDELAILRRTTNVAVVETDDALVRKKAQERIMREVDALVPSARDKYPDAFVAHFEAMASADDDDVKEGIRQAVNEQLDSELSALKQRRAAVQNEPGKIDAVERETDSVIHKGQQDLLRGRTEERHQEHLDRIARIKRSEQRLLKPAEVNSGSLTELMECTPVHYKTNIGKLEAEINDLRNLIYEQRAEEEKLLLERSARINMIESEHSDLQDEVTKLTTLLSQMQDELDMKRSDAQNMSEAQVPRVGKWAVEIQGLEESVEYGAEEEARLKRDFEGVSAAVNSVDADKRLLEEKFNQEFEELSNLQEQYRSLVDQIEEQLTNSKDKVMAIRQEILQDTRRINDLRWNTGRGGEEMRDTKRALAERLNQSISMLAIEERLQSIIQAKIILVEESTESLRQTWNAQITDQVKETENLKRQIEQKLKSIHSLTDELANLKTGMQAGVSGSAPYSVSQYKEMIEERSRQWAAIVFDTSRQVSDTKARILVNEEENEMLLDGMGHIVITGRVLEKEGLDIENSTNAELAATANRMYDDLASASYRESKLNQLIRIFKDVEERRARGEQVPKLTGKKHLTRGERRSKRSVKENSWLAKEIAKQNISLQSAFPLTDERQTGPYQNLSPARDPQAPSFEQEHKLRVINFIKSEIQPLYDTEQITKKRFIDIVARASTAFLETHPATPALTPEDQQWLARKIQEVITLQDEVRSRRRADNSLLRSQSRQ